MNDQRKLWNNAHDKGDIRHYSDSTTEFAKEVLEIINPSSRILELGCGVGNDSIGFANAGHTVVATDFSEVAIAKNTKRWKNSPNLTFQVIDINQPLEFQANNFDVVYARLSLHYFSDIDTKKIFQEIHRVLKPKGYLCFICKSVKDPLNGKGEEIEKDMFELDGHVRHFFSEEYAKSLLRNGFTIERLESGAEKFYGSDSAYVKAFARAIK
jgi:ubiquinone/menaquinone biosynthesis C-methylase UbiE